MYKICAAFTMSISVALVLASNQAFGQSGAAQGGSSASMHSTSHPSVTRSAHQRIGRNRGAFFPTTGGLLLGAIEWRTQRRGRATDGLDIRRFHLHIQKRFSLGLGTPISA